MATPEDHGKNVDTSENNFIQSALQGYVAITDDEQSPDEQNLRIVSALASIDPSDSFDLDTQALLKRLHLHTFGAQELAHGAQLLLRVGPHVCSVDNLHRVLRLAIQFAQLSRLIDGSAFENVTNQEECFIRICQHLGLHPTHIKTAMLTADTMGMDPCCTEVIEHVVMHYQVYRDDDLVNKFQDSVASLKEATIQSGVEFAPLYLQLSAFFKNFRDVACVYMTSIDILKDISEGEAQVLAKLIHEHLEVYTPEAVADTFRTLYERTKVELHFKPGIIDVLEILVLREGPFPEDTDWINNLKDDLLDLDDAIDRAEGNFLDAKNVLLMARVLEDLRWNSGTSTPHPFWNAPIIDFVEVYRDEKPLIRFILELSTYLHPLGIYMTEHEVTEAYRQLIIEDIAKSFRLPVNKIYPNDDSSVYSEVSSPSRSSSSKTSEGEYDEPIIADDATVDLVDLIREIFSCKVGEIKLWEPARLNDLLDQIDFAEEALEYCHYDMPQAIDYLVMRRLFITDAQPKPLPEGSIPSLKLHMEKFIASLDFVAESGTSTRDIETLVARSIRTNGYEDPTVNSGELGWQIARWFKMYERPDIYDAFAASLMKETGKSSSPDRPTRRRTIDATTHFKGFDDIIDNGI